MNRDDLLAALEFFTDFAMTEGEQAQAERLTKAVRDLMQEREAAIGYMRTAWQFLRDMMDTPLPEDADSDRREATEDLELALRAFGVDVYSPPEA